VNESELEKLAQQLGAGAAGRLDVERTAQAVVTRLRDAPPLTVTARLGRQPAWLKIAAAVVLLLGAGLVTRGLWHGPTTTGTLVGSVVEDLSDLTPPQLRETIASLDLPWGQESWAVDTGLEGLSADELRALLRTLEG
jgi:hypothetical protein